MAREVPPAGVGQFRGFHNGRKMQDLLPLWQGAEDRGAQEVPLAGVGQFRGFRNGRKMQDSLPLWQGAEDRAGRAGRGRPQVPIR